MLSSILKWCFFTATFIAMGATAKSAVETSGSDPTIGLNGFPPILHCDSSFSPIRSASGTKIKVLVSKTPFAVVAVDATGKVAASFKSDQINGKVFSPTSFDCKESLRASATSFQAGVACLTTTVPEPNRFSFIGEISLGTTAIGAPFEGQLTTGTSDRPSSGALYLWNCIAGL